MISTLFILCSLAFCESKEMMVQIYLDQEGYSCSAIDGQWGLKSRSCLARYLSDRKLLPQGEPVPGPSEAYDRFFANRPNPFRIEEVVQSDLDALVTIPGAPSERAALPRMGYESIREMFAERGHLSQTALAKLNPGVDWNTIRPGLKLVIPDFPSITEELKSVNLGRKSKKRRPEAAVVRVSVTGCTVSAVDAENRTIAIFPCSIAARKAKVPPHGELKITNCVPWPNYTYTPDHTPPGKKVQRHVWPAGENCPVGVAWMGLNLPGYGIHGTPHPESIGFTGSHGCFRLANWNAARLFAMCRPGTRVVIEP